MFKFRIFSAIFILLVINNFPAFSQIDSSLLNVHELPINDSIVINNFVEETFSGEISQPLSVSDTIKVINLSDQPVFNSSVDSLKVLNLDSLRQAGLILFEPQPKVDIQLTREQAIELLQKQVKDKYWRDPEDRLKTNIEHLLVFATTPTINATKQFFSEYPTINLQIPWDKFYAWDTLRFKLPGRLGIDTSLYNSNNMFNIDSLDINRHVDSTNIIASRSLAILDTTVLVSSKQLDKVGSDSPLFPFNYYTSPYQSDSLIVAVKTIISFLNERDSTLITINGKNNNATHVWLNSKSDIATRYWLKSDVGDSVTVWISSPERNSLYLDLEHGVNFRRPILQSNYSEVNIEREKINQRALQDANNIVTKKQYWKTHSEASLSLSQAAMSNWVKGGENSVSLLTDLVGYADYENKAKKVTSTNFARLKYGIITSGEDGIRKNVDLLETSSKLSTKAFGKFDLSSYLLFKTTLTKGYNYPNDSVAVSKFMNPGTITLGIGLDYKPNKKTSMNFSPLSYKATIVTDTVHIDQTLYGITNDKKSKHEPGASFLFTNTWDISKKLKMVNKLQLFTNYIDKPQNIDIDWEMTFTAKLNWFTDFKLNTHLIFDDNTKTIEYDKDNNPVLGDNGEPKKTSRVQFKELIGFSFVFTF